MGKKYFQKKGGGDDISKKYSPLIHTQVQKCLNVSEIFLLQIDVPLWVSNQWKDKYIKIQINILTLSLL